MDCKDNIQTEHLNTKCDLDVPQLKNEQPADAPQSEHPNAEEIYHLTVRFSLVAVFFSITFNRPLLAQNSISAIQITYPKAAVLKLTASCARFARDSQRSLATLATKQKSCAQRTPHLCFYSPVRRRVAEAGQGILTNMFENVAAQRIV